MEAVDLSKIVTEEHEGRWVLYSPSKGQVFASDEDLDRLMDKAANIEGEEDLRIHRVIPFNERRAPQNN